MITLIFSHLFPVMLITLLLQAGAPAMKLPIRKSLLTIIHVVSATIISVIPIGGISIARYIVTLEANVSIPMLVLMFHRIWGIGEGRRLIQPAQQSRFYHFALVSGLILYPASLGLGPFDPYALGWGFLPFFPVVMVLTIVLAFTCRPLSAALLLSILACNLRLLESSNLWDYLIDPYLFFLSAGMLVHEAVGRLKNRAFSPSED